MKFKKLFNVLLISLLICSKSFAYDPYADQVQTDVDNFDKNLSAADTDVQKALETIDDLNIGGSPLTTKGDLFTYSTLETRLPVGVDGQILSSNSAETTGLKWINNGTAEWGLITGTLSNQTDLQAELDLKYDSADFNGDFDTRLATKDITDLGTYSHSSLTDLDYASAGHTGFEPTVTKGDLTAGSSKVNVLGGTGAVIGTGTSVDVVESNISHLNISDIGSYAHSAIDTHIDDSTIHFTEASIDHTAIQNIGANTHAQIDTALGTTIPNTYVPYTGAISDVDLGIYDIIATEITGTQQTSSQPNINHNSLLNTHNLTTDIDHNTITNTHNLTSDLQPEWDNITGKPTEFNPSAHATTHEVGGSDLVNHDSLTGFVGNEHIDHTTVNLTAGNGLTGGGDISANRSFAVGEGTGISVSADTVSTNDSEIDHNALLNTHNLTTDIDHTLITNIGTNTHPQIDTHIADATIHFLEGDIDHSEIDELEWSVAGHIIDTDIDINENSLLNVNHIDFNTTYTPPTESEGRVSWNPTYYTVDIPSGLGYTNQAGQEVAVIVINTTGSTVPSGKAIRLTAVSGGYPTFELAKADSSVTLRGGILITTTSMEDGEIGAAVTFGRVNVVNTVAIGAGPSFISADIAGDLTNVRPSFPDYEYPVGAVEVLDAVNGVISVDVVGAVDDTLQNFWNGCFRESFDFRVTSTGGVITGTLTPTNGHPDMTMIFSDGFSILDTDPGATITLTAGTDSIPQTNYVYIPQSTKVLTVSTSDWPTTFEHIKVAQVYLRTAATTETDGALRNQNWNDHIEDTSTFQGHLSHIGERIRSLVAEWNTGTETSLTVTGGVSDVWVANTAGNVYQMHLQDFPAIDMSTGDDIHVVNDPISAYRTTDNLNDLTVDSNGDTLNNKWFSIVVWGVANKTGEASHIMCNLPSGSYNLESGALSDASGFTNYTIPTEFKGTGFLMARFTMRKSGTTFTYDSGTGYQDLRGFFPNTTAGSGAGSSGITTFLGLTDTPSAYTGEALSLAQVNAGETALEFTATPTITNLNITETTDKNYVTDAEAIVIGNTSGVNTGDQVSSDFTHNDLTGLNAGTDYEHITETQETNFEAAYTHVSSTGADHTYIDQSVVSGSTPTFTNTNFTEATDKNYVSDAQLVVIGNTSGVNTGDQDLSNYFNKTTDDTDDITDTSTNRFTNDTDITRLANTSGTNTGDQTSIVGITGTKAEFDTAVTDGNFAYAGGAYHDGFSDYVAGEHFLQSAITEVGTIATGVWQGTAIDGAYIDIEGTEIKSTGEVGATKFLREDGDGTCSWQEAGGASYWDRTGTVLSPVNAGDDVETSGAGTFTSGVNIDADSVKFTQGIDGATDCYSQFRLNDWEFYSSRSYEFDVDPNDVGNGVILFGNTTVADSSSSKVFTLTRKADTEGTDTIKMLISASQDCQFQTSNDFFFNINGNLGFEADTDCYFYVGTGFVARFKDNEADFQDSVIQTTDSVETPAVVYPSTQVPSADVNTLDDYEEGTWTPIYTTSGTDFSSVTYDTSITGGLYIKVGKLVHVQGAIRTNGITKGSASGNVQVGGLPFILDNAGSGLADYASFTISYSISYLGDRPNGIRVAQGGTVGTIMYKATANGDSLALQVADMSTGSNQNYMFFTGTYQASS